MPSTNEGLFMSEYLTPEDVDKLLKLPRGLARRLGRRGKLPSTILINGTIRFESEALQAYLKSSSTTPPEKAVGQ